MREKTYTRWVWNEELQDDQLVEYGTGKYHFDEEDKIAIVSEYVGGHVPASQIIEKYHISSRQVLFNWMDKYVNEKELVSLRAVWLYQAIILQTQGERLRRGCDRGP